MGEARHNPLSPQFRGPRPDHLVGFDTQVQFEPNAAGLARIKAAEAQGIEAPRLTSDELDFVAYGFVSVVTTSLVGPDGKAPLNARGVGVVYRCKLSEALQGPPPEAQEEAPCPTTST